MDILFKLEQIIWLKDNREMSMKEKNWESFNFMNVMEKDLNFPLSHLCLVTSLFFSWPKVELRVASCIPWIGLWFILWTRFTLPILFTLNLSPM